MPLLDILMVTYFFHLVFLGLQAIQSIKVENVSELHFMQSTNRFHVTVHLFSNRTQMGSKCGKNKKVAHKAIAECVILMSFVICFIQ